MKFGRVVIAVAALGALVAADPALARSKHKARARCIDPPVQFPWGGFLASRPEPRPNGCAPPVYQYGKFIGQDPDRNIRHQLYRDPGTGYSAVNN